LEEVSGEATTLGALPLVGVLLWSQEHFLRDVPQILELSLFETESAILSLEKELWYRCMEISGKLPSQEGEVLRS
jgi:hypothetical protein